MRPIRLLALLALLAAPAAVAETDAPDVSPAIEAALSAGADVVILGEIHDDPGHHRAQAAAIRQMTAAGLRPTVVFEMVPSDLQPALEALAARGIAGMPEIDERLAWSARGWGDVALYEPVFEAALEAGLPLEAGDLPRDVIRKLAREGVDSLPAGEADRLDLLSPMDASLEARLRDLLVASHCGMMTADQMDPLVLVQRARDGAMAAAVRDAAAAGPVVLITGQGHARRDWGVPAVLSRIAPDLVVRSIALASDDSNPDGGFDDVVATGPAPERGDPCEAMRQGK